MTPIDNTATITNPGGPGAAPAAPTLLVSPSALPSSGAKPLYLRSTPAVALSRNPPGTDAAVTVAFGAPVAWTLTPTLALPRDAAERQHRRAALAAAQHRTPAPTAERCK